MTKREDKTPPGTWAKPLVRRLAGGSAEFGGGGAVDGSASQS
ncbi:MAG: hypothetical protein WBR13_04690 [Allosphingosinicella sp.]